MASADRGELLKRPTLDRHTGTAATIRSAIGFGLMPIGPSASRWPPW
jgi:hypothetical protein